MGLHLSGSTTAQLNNAYARRWAANTAYTAGDTVVAPDGSLVKAKATFTSGGTYSSANWTTVSALSGTQARTELDALYAGQIKWNLVDKLPSVWYAGHRGGLTIWPEESIESYRACLAGGFIPELDIQLLSDGTMVPIHDTTVTRTMTGVSGNVSALTKAQWKAGRVRDPSTLGGEQYHPPTWEEILNELGGRIVLMPEAKVTGVITPLIASITVRGLHRSVILQSTTYSEAQQSATAGVCTMYLSDTVGTGGANPTPAQVFASGIEYVGVSTAVTSAYVTSLTAAGLKVVVYAVATQATATTFFGYGATGLICDDPWHVTSAWKQRDTDEFYTKRLWPRWASSGQTNFRFARQDELGVGKENVAGLTGVMCLRFIGTRGPNVRLRWRQRFGVTSTTALTGFGGMFIGVTPDVDTIFTDLANVAGQQGYYAFHRRNGDLQLLRIDPGAQVTLASNTTTDPDVAANTTEGFMDLELTIDATSVTFKNLTTGTSVTSADTTYRPTTAMVHAKVSANHVMFSRVTLDDLP